MFAETEDQELFGRAAARFLDEHSPVERVRALADEDSTFDPAVWREAAALGWTTLLVPEAAGGGSISGNGLADLLIVAELFGRHAAPGPLFGTNAVAAALGRWGTPEQQAGPLAELLAGDAVAAWAQATGAGPLGAPSATVVATASGDTVVLDGPAGAVESAADAAYLLVTATEAAGRSQYLVPRETPGVELTPLRAIDVTRRFHAVGFRQVVVPAAARVGAPGAGDAQDSALLDLVAVLALGEMAGAMDRAFAMTLDWTFDRYSFGRPLGAYQEIKHRMADLRTQLEAGAAAASHAAFAVGTDAPDAREWVSAGMAHVGRHAPEVIQDCIQLHGGIGVTTDLDLHLYLRRVVLDANLYGTPAMFARRLGAAVATREGVLA